AGHARFGSRGCQETRGRFGAYVPPENCPTQGRLLYLPPGSGSRGPAMLENLDRGMSGESRCGAPEFEDILSTRRAALKKLGRFTSISAPAVTLLLAGGMEPARAVPCRNCAPTRRLNARAGDIGTAAV